MSNVIVNGIKYDIKGTKLYYKDICDLAGLPNQPGYTVIYKYKGGGNSDFLSDDAEDGVYLDPESMVVFNIARTNNA